MSEPLRDLTSSQRTLLALRAMQLRKAAGPAGIPRAHREGERPAFPLSFAQQQLWLVDQLEEHRAAYNVPLALRLEGRLDRAVLERCIAAVAERHEVLRATFELRDREPVQVVAPAEPVPVREVDLRHLPPEERDAAAVRHAQAEAREPFDLARGPLFRAALLRLAGDDHVLLLTMHHIVSDGWSIGVLLRELAALYAAFTEGRPSPLAPLPVQYTDYAAWQRRERTGALAEHLEYWKERLAGDLPALELPRDHAPAERAGGAAVESLLLPASLAASLRSLALEEQATPFMVLLAAFHALLHRYTGQRDVLTATAAANRDRPELEGLVGFFINTLVVRTPVAGDPPFREWLREVRGVVLGAFAHADVPLEQVVRALDLPRDLERQPLAGVMFVHRVAEEGSHSLPGLGLRPFPVPTGGETFDLSFNVVESPDGLLVQVTYSTDYYEAATIRRLAGHYATLLEAVAADPGERLAALPLLTRAEREELAALNRTGADYCDAPLHVQVEAQVRRTPEAVALEAGGERLSYAEVNRRANRLAHLLRARGVGPDGSVGLLLERSPEMVVAVLGILKAGAACVPLDPAYPEERLRLMVEDAGAGLVVTRGELPGLPAAMATVCLDRDAARLAEMPVDDPESGAHADTLVYVIFTSGSTGRPKAVGVPHRTMANLLAWQHADPRYTRGARTLQFATLSFDASFQEIFSTWMTGGALVVVPEAVHKDAAQWVPLLASAGIERMFLPFVALRQMAELVDEGAPLPAGLRELLPAGEQLQVTPAVVRLFERLPGCRMHNLYGPSETHVVTAHTLEGPPASWPALPPIGTPVWNTRAHVLDAEMAPVPLGIVGELYVGGDNLARGYLGRPDLTAERFVPDPFAPAPGERLYRTGDRVRRRPGGSIDFLGRADEQVKIRGFRVEPGEVETRIAEHPSVRGVVVTARPDAGTGKRLVAHVVPGAPLTVTELRAFLEARVPPYMIPAAFVFLERFPLLPSGKTDRRSLPEPEAVRPELEGGYAAPRTPEEELLAGVWARVLGVDRVGIHDSFLELGGDSILAIQVVSRSRRAGLRTTLKQVFDLRTVAAVAAAAVPAEPAAPPADGSDAAREGTAGAWARVREEVPDAEAAYPLSPMQQGILFHSLVAEGSGAYVEHVRLRYRGPVDRAALDAAWERLVARHPVLRTTFLWEGLDRPLQVVHPRGELPVEWHDRRGRGAERQDREPAGRPGAGDGPAFAPDRLPLAHVSVRLLEDEELELVWSFHHLVLDGWSVEAVLGELRELYAALREGREAVQPERAAFREYVEWVERQPLDEARAYWRGALAGLEAGSPLALGTPAAAGAEEYRRESVRLTPAATALLRDGARRNGLTLYDLLQGAWAVLLARHGGEEDVVFGSVVSGRSVDMDGAPGVVGVTLNTLPVRVRVRPGAPLRAWLEELQREQREARQYEYVPLAEIQRQSPAGAGTPLFASILDLLSYPDEQGDGWGPRRWSMPRTGYPLFLMAYPDEALELEATYETAVCGGPEVARTLALLATLLEGMAATLAGPAAESARVGDLPWVTEEERVFLLREWNRTGAEVPAGSFQELFEAQAARTPGAIAVVFRGERVSYAELNRRANRAARTLVAEGAGPESVVALLAERSADFLVAVLAVFKAGAAYLPLDPAHPARRHRQVLEQSRSTLALAGDGLRAALDEAVEGMDPAARPRVLPLREVLDRPQDGADVPVRAAPGGLAYVIFTSGSTGAPKGAMVEHRGMLNHLHAKIIGLEITARDRVAQTASQCFDISVWQFLAALVVGGEVHVFPDEVSHDPAALAAEVEQGGITILETVPSLMRMLVEELRQPHRAPPALRALRWMIPTGEALPPELARDWLDAYPRVPLLNAYGPTECSDDVTHHPIHQPPAPEVRHMPIGRQVVNVRLYVLDPGLEPVPAGVPGELFVGGICVGRGYAHDPRRTAEAFVPDPFGGEPGARLYRTGDRVRLLPAGDLEFLGRIDFQVKIRGFRIELGEIESVLAEHPAVRQAAVVARESEGGDRRLAAYLVVEPDAPPSVAELRAHVAAALPEYMTPAAFVLLDALPLSSNGKLDRRALPAPDEAALHRGSAYLPPLGDTELRLAAVWQAVLRVERVGREDNFFELGGDSILAITVASRAREEGLPFTPRELFRHQTLAELAAAVAADPAGGRPSPDAAADTDAGPAADGHADFGWSGDTMDEMFDAIERALD